MTNWIKNYLTQHEHLTALPVARRSRYSLHLRRGRRERLALVSAAPIHYFDSGAWQPLDTRLQLLANGRFGAPGLPFSLGANGEVRLRGSRHRHKTVGVGLYTGGVYKEITRFHEGKRHGNRLIRAAGDLRHETILHPRGLREELIIEQPLHIDASPEAMLVIETILPAHTFKPGLLPEAGRYGFRLPAAWAYSAPATQATGFTSPTQPTHTTSDAPVTRFIESPRTTLGSHQGVDVLFPAKPGKNSNATGAFPVATTPTKRRGGSKTLPPAPRIPVLRWVEEKDGRQVMYSGVPLDWLANAVYPVVIDPDLDITGHSADGHIEGSSVATSTTHSDSGATMNVGGRDISGANFLWRDYLKFNTSSLGPEAVVTKANLRMFVTDASADVAWTIYVRQYDWSANDPMASGTREAAWDGLLAASNAAVLTTSAVSSGPVTSADLPEGWIAIEGNTYYGLWCDQEGFAFGTNEGAMHAYAAADHATPENRPLLMIEYLAGYPTSGPIPLIARFPSPQPTLLDTRIKLRARKRRTLLTAKMKDE